MNEASLFFEQTRLVGIITLNRPARLNAISLALQCEMLAMLDECERNGAVRALVITGGPKQFSVGADIKELAGAESLAPFLAQGRALFHKIESFGKPVIAAISGPAFGGGLEMALCCDLRIASTSAKLGLSEIKLGALPAGGGTQRLTRLVGASYAKQLILTGNPIDAAEAYRIGLVNAVQPAGMELDAAVEWATEIAGRAPIAVRLAKSCIDTAAQVNLESGLNYEAQCAAYLAGTEDQKEGMRAFVEKRKPEFQGR